MGVDTVPVGFNPRPRMGGDRASHGRYKFPCCFNPRPRMGGDPIASMVAPARVVSIHAPAWGATTTLAGQGWPSWFQSTPPHGGRRLAYCILVVIARVSIHAPAWGATDEAQDLNPLMLFQSTPPHGGRQPIDFYQAVMTPVSIHAPAWGATGF